MKIKYGSLLLLFGAVINSACGQEGGQPNLTSPVTKEQYNAISKEVKSFDYNPTYQVRFTAADCSYEIYVNDMLASFSFTTGNTAGEQNVDIPQYILGSGKQELKIKLFPKAIADGQPEASLSADAVFKGRIVHGQYGKTEADKFTQVTSFEVPAAAGKPEIEYKISFEAKVPYNLQGWAGGTDLRKENREQLLKEVKGIYQQFSKAYQTKNIGKIAAMIYDREKEVAQAFFYKSGERGSYERGWEKLTEEAAKVVSIKVAEDAELKFLADGKVVALLVAKGEERDFPAIEAETEKSYVYYGLYLFRPAAGAPLKVIR